jgi:transcription initiation factor TFIIB
MWRLFNEEYPKEPLTLTLTQPLASVADGENTSASVAKDTDADAHVDADAKACKRKNECQVCNSELALADMGFYICTNTRCGVLCTKIIDWSAEWRSYYNDDNNNGVDPTRCGLPINPLLKESSYGCSVAKKSNMSSKMRYIKQYTEWSSMPYTEKALYDEFQTIIIMANNASIPKIIVDDALRYHKKISATKKFRGINRDGIIAASVYISCRVNKYPRTAKEIASIFMLQYTNATRGCKNAMNIMNELEINLDAEDKTLYHETTPVVFIERFCSKLNINNELIMLGKFIALKIERMSLITDNTPHSIAVGIIYLISCVCNLNINKRQISKISDVSEVTITKCYNKMTKHTDILIPSIIIEKYKN